VANVVDMARRGIMAGSLGAVLGGALGGVAGFGVYAWLDPVLAAAGTPWEELQGIVASLVLIGTGAGLAVGCAVALRLRHHVAALVTSVVLLAALPFAAPLVALASRLHWTAALLAGVLLVVAVVAGTRLVVTRAAPTVGVGARGEASGPARRSPQQPPPAS
jgi:hypothetical protein